MKKSFLIGVFALAMTGVEVQAQALNTNNSSSVRTETSADALHRGDRRGRDWDRGGRDWDRRGRDWDHGRRGRYWPWPRDRWDGDWDSDQYVCHARGNRGRILYRGDGWNRSSARSQALNRCYRNSNNCYITSCYRD